MSDDTPSSPLEVAVFLTGVGFDFMPKHVVISFEYPEKFGDIHGPKKEASFLVENGLLRDLGAKFIEVAGMVEQPKGNA